MKHALKIIEKMYNGLVTGIVYIAISLTLFMVLCISFSIFLRRTPFSFGWGLEASEYILIIITFFGTGWLLKTGGHISVDIIPNAIRGRTQDIYNGVIYSIVAMVCLVLTISGFSTGWEAYVAGTLQIKVYTFPKWILISLVPFGGFFLFVESAKLSYGYFAGKTILIVDDEEDIIESLRELLTGYRIHIAMDFAAASEKLRDRVYDAVVLDITGVRGHDLLRLSTERGFPTIMLTANALNPDALKKSMQLGAVSFLPKDEMGNIAGFLQDALTMKKKDARVEFYVRLVPYFDRRFGNGWDKNEAFWSEAREISASRKKE
ncbi:MAG: TRAP transporter small permease subunit [Pseudomonadota bacterium]